MKKNNKWLKFVDEKDLLIGRIYKELRRRHLNHEAKKADFFAMTEFPTCRNCPDKLTNRMEISFGSHVSCEVF